MVIITQYTIHNRCSTKVLLEGEDKNLSESEAWGIDIWERMNLNIFQLLCGSMIMTKLCRAEPFLLSKWNMYTK